MGFGNIISNVLGGSKNKKPPVSQSKKRRPSSSSSTHKPSKSKYSKSDGKHKGKPT